jgi:hypothetical protein
MCQYDQLMLKRAKLERSDPLRPVSRPISSRSDNYETSTFHDSVTLEICWINS